VKKQEVEPLPPFRKLNRLKEKELRVLIVQKDDIERRIELATIDLKVELHEKQKEIRAFLIAL
jgi:hypothetical protein